MNRLQTFLAKGKDLIRQRVMHPRNEPLESNAHNNFVIKNAAIKTAQTTATSTAASGTKAGALVSLSPILSFQVATQTALATLKKHQNAKVLLFQLRRPFRSGYLLKGQRRMNNLGRATANQRQDFTEDELDQFWHLQNQYQGNKRDQTYLDKDENDRDNDDLSSSLASSQMSVLEKDPYEGAYEGIMSVFDDPKKAGMKQFCSQKVETTGAFIHRQNVRPVAQDVDSQSLKESVFHIGGSCSSSAFDSVNEAAQEGTKAFLFKLKEQMVFDREDACSELYEQSNELAQSLDVDYDYELLSSISDNDDYSSSSALSYSQVSRKGILVRPL